MEGNEDDEDLNDRYPPMWTCRSGEHGDGTALGIDHGDGQESESEPTGLFALVAQSDGSTMARSEVPSIPSSLHTPAASLTSEDDGRLSRCSSQECDPFSHRRGSDLGPGMVHMTSNGHRARAESASTPSSTGGDAIAASMRDGDAVPQSSEARPPVWRGHSTQTIFPLSHPEPSRPTSVPTTLSRRDGPGYPSYPNQSFFALQSQVYTPPYPPRPWRARNSNPSQNPWTRSNTADGGYPPTTASGAKTVGSTPVHSPRLFTPTMSRNRASGDESEDSHYNTPLLHHTHLQAPIE